MKYLALLVLLLLSLQQTAEAQSDRSGRDDTSDYRLSQRKQPAATVLGFDGGSERGFYSETGVSGLYATNAGQTRSDEVSTVYATPYLSLGYLGRPQGGWTPSADLTADADFFAEKHDDLNEVRLSPTLKASRSTRLGELSLGVRSRAAFGHLANIYYYTRGGPFVRLKPTFGNTIGLAVDGEFRFADDANERRLLLIGSFEREVVRLSAKTNVRFLQELRFSAFRAGDNDGRRDLRSSSTLRLDPSLSLGRGSSVTLDAILFHNMSNRREKRFTDFEIGPSLVIPLG